MKTSPAMSTSSFNADPCTGKVSATRFSPVPKDVAKAATNNETIVSSATESTPPAATVISLAR